MMTQSTPFIVLVTALLINTLCYCSGENVYCVTPTATTCSSCPQNSIHCATLSEYAQEAGLYFISNTTMVFLPGDHVLDTNITVANVATLTMCGESSSNNKATVVRNGSVGFSFMNMVDFNIHSLAFTASYNRSWSYGRHPASNSALLLQSTQYAKLINCSFHDNLGTAIIAYKTNITLAENSEFIHNQCGIAALNSNLRFTGNTSFHKNIEYGAIWGSASSLDFAGTSNFISNSALNGGAIFAGSNTLLNFNGTSDFSHNSAEVGGAIYIHANAILTFNGTNNFINNSADFGGAVYAGTNTLLTFIGTSVFSNNSADWSGGAIYLYINVVLSLNGTNNFINNSARYYGGAVYAQNKTLLTFIGSSVFSNNSADSTGGAIYLYINVVLSLNGTNDFINNSAGRSGGAVYAETNTSLTFIGTSVFSNNSADWTGGAIYLNINVVLSLNGTNNFINNSAVYSGSPIIFTGTNNFIFGNSIQQFSGGAISTRNAVLTFTGTNNFINNSAVHCGGSIGTYDDAGNILTFSGTNNFIGNSVKRYGGAICTSINAVFTFTGINNFINNLANGPASNGGAISTSTSGNAVLIFNGTNNFTGNSANYYGGVIFASSNSSLTFIGTTGFSNNFANRYDGSAIYAETKTLLKFTGISDFIANTGGAISICDYVVIIFTGTINFISNSAMKGGAILADRNSKLTFDGNISFTNNGHDSTNEVSRGGAIYLALNSTFSILPHTTVRWENNHATLGGAIYISDINPLIYCSQTAPYIAAYVPREECFFQLPGQNLSSINVKLVFKNNSADDAGSMLYGGAIDNCKLRVTDLDLHYSSGDVFDMLVQYEADTDYSTTSKISSDPLHICVCSNNLLDCRSRYSYIPFPVYPGETFQLSVPTVTVGQRDGTVSSTVRSTAITYVDSHPVNLLDYQYLQHTNNTCTKLNYTVFSLSREVKIELYPEDSPCSRYFDRKMKISVNLNQTCPPGFNISESARSCVCEQRLTQYTNQCNITNRLGQITRDLSKHFWIGYDNSSHELILHPYCPLDYCVNDTVVFPLNNTDIQCAHNRSGFLCGRCKEGYSLVIGTHHCRKCTNIHLVLLIPFAVTGVALVSFLFVCKLTVATGTLSGLVMYANIVGVNRTIFIPVKSTDPLSVFIAWLNLDFGIETCFYNGLDAYSSTWLQFVFPVYLWLLVGLMILVSHFSQRFANLLGNNPVSVLATLILLSYAKIFRTLIATVYFTNLEYPTYNRRAWLYDANIDYIIGKHIPLFLVAVLVFFFLFLPYTLLLLFGQWLQAISHLRFFSWVNSARLKPFMDSYHAPYKAKHRYWPGLLLVLRFVLLLVFALNPQQDPNINLLAILVGAGILQLWAWVSGGVYKNWFLDALEGSFTLNLIILGAATYYVSHSGGNQLAVGYTSVSIALVTFIGILCYHIFQQLRHTKLWKKMPKPNLQLKKKLNTKQAVNNLNNPTNDPTESMNLDQLREPWLEDLLQPTHSSF